MLVTRAVLLTTLGFCYGSAQTPRESRDSLVAEETVQLQLDGMVGSGVIQVTSYPAYSSSASIPESLSGLSTTSTLVSETPLPASTRNTTSGSRLITTLRPPMSFGSSHSQIVNHSSFAQSLPSAVASSSMVTASIGAANSTRNASTYPGLFEGTGSQLGVLGAGTWLWIAVAEIALGIL